MRFSKRLEGLSSGIFAEIAALKAAMLKNGADVIDMSVGSPDGAPDAKVLEAYLSAGARGDAHGYPLRDTPEFREAVKGWYKRRFGVELDAATQIHSLIGSQEGLAHITLALCDPGDVVLVPDPGYPIYEAGPTVAGARLVRVPMLPEKGYAMDLDAINPNDLRAARLIVAAYPNNPTCALAPEGFYEKLVEFCKSNDIIALHDNAYCELVFDGKISGSFLQTPGAMDVGVEFASCSKMYNMAGFRIGFAVGNEQVISRLAYLKSQLDYGVHLPVQEAAVAALSLPFEGPGQVSDTREAYRRRRDVLVDALNAAGWNVSKPQGTMFVWAKLPNGEADDAAFAKRLAERTAVLVTPGSCFGPAGKGHIRMALGLTDERVAEAGRRMAGMEL